MIYLKISLLLKSKIHKIINKVYLLILYSNSTLKFTLLNMINFILMFKFRILTNSKIINNIQSYKLMILKLTLIINK